MAYSIPNYVLADASSDTTLTQSFDASGGLSGKRVLVVFVTSRDESSSNVVPTVTFNGDSLTAEVNDHSGESNQNERIAAFYRVAPDSVTGDVVVTFSETQDDISVGIALLSGVKEQAPEASAARAPGAASTSDSIAVTTVTADAAVVGMMSKTTSTSISVTGGQTELDQDWTGDVRTSLCHEEGPATPGSETMSWSWSSLAERMAAAMAFAVDSGPTGTAASTLPVPTMSASGARGNPGAAAPTLPVVSMSASGGIAAVVSGTAAPSLPLPAMAADGGVGDSWCSGYTRGDLPDTVFLSRSASSTLSDLADDIGQDDDDLTVGTNCVYETSDRFDPGSSGTVVLRVNIDTGDGTGYLFDVQDRGGGERLRFLQDGGTQIRGQVVTNTGANSASGTFTPEAWSATEKECVLALAWEPNPDTTGADDAATFWIYVFDVAAGTSEIFSFTGFTPGACDYQGRFLASATTGDDAFGGTCEEIAVYDGFHPPSTVYHWFVQGFAAETYSGRERLEVPLPQASGNVADEDMPVSLVALAAGAIQQADRRGASPIINEIYNGVAIEDPEGSFPGSDAILAPGQDELVLMVGFLKYRPVPNQFNRLWCRLHVTLGGDGTDNQIAVYSMAQRPGQTGGGVVVAPPPPPEVHRTTVITRSTPGMARLDLGELKIARDPHGWTYLAIAVEATTNITVHGWHVSPHSVDETGTISGFEAP